MDDTFSADGKHFFGDGAVVIPTPGHTPGHISIYISASKTLIAADAVVLENSEFHIANPQFTLDLEQALVSVKKLLQLDIETMICYHGGVIEDKINQKLERLVARYSDK